MSLILSIDDSSFQRKRIHEILLAGGFDVVQAEDGQAGLEKVIEETPDCILVDLLMPELDGFQFLEKHRESGSRVPVIVLSADVQESAKQKCTGLGARAFVHKPPRKEELIQTINSILAEAQKL